MSRRELTALRSTGVSWDRLEEQLPSVYEAIGVAPDSAAKDGKLTIQDHGAHGCVIHVDGSELGRRLALDLARRFGATVEIYEVIATGGGKGFKFRTEAYKATAAGELKAAEGVELDFDDPEQDWGGGDLQTRGERVLRDFGTLRTEALRTRSIGLKRRSGGKASSPRVATLLKSLQKAKSHEGIPTADGRIELRIELAAGGRQTSFCTTAEYEELRKLLGGRKG